MTCTRKLGGDGECLLDRIEINRTTSSTVKSGSSSISASKKFRLRGSTDRQTMRHVTHDCG
jgi:hypothetical protein